MKKILYGLICVLLCACSFTAKSDPAKFYSLQPKSIINKTTAKQNITVGIYTVKIPTYVDRYQIVTRKNNSSEIEIHEFSRWIDMPSEIITQSVVENMTCHTKNLIARAMPIKSSTLPNYTVKIDITKLDSEIDGETTLDAWWIIYDASNNIIAEKHTIIQEATPTIYKNNLQPIINTYELAIAKLSNKIADEIIKH